MAKTYKVAVTAEASGDIEQACLWIAEADPAAALRWYEGLMNAVSGLSRLPLRCPLAPEYRLGLADEEIRQLLYGKGYWRYRILYAVERHRVVVLHVRHGARLYLGQEPEGEDSEPE